MKTDIIKILLFLTIFLFGFKSYSQNFDPEQLKIDTVNFDVSYCLCDGDDNYIIIMICKEPSILRETDKIQMNAHLSFNMHEGDIITFIYVPEKKMISEISRSDF